MGITLAQRLVAQATNSTLLVTQSDSKLDDTLLNQSGNHDCNHHHRDGNHGLSGVTDAPINLNEDNHDCNQQHPDCNQQQRRLTELATPDLTETTETAKPPPLQAIANQQHRDCNQPADYVIANQRHHDYNQHSNTRPIGPNHRCDPTNSEAGDLTPKPNPACGPSVRLPESSVEPGASSPAAGDPQTAEFPEWLSVCELNRLGGVTSCGPLTSVIGASCERRRASTGECCDQHYHDDGFSAGLPCGTPGDMPSHPGEGRQGAGLRPAAVPGPAARAKPRMAPT